MKTIYRTNDGKEFDTQHAARIHERVEDNRVALMRKLEAIGFSQDAAKGVLAHAPAIYQWLRDTLMGVEDDQEEGDEKITNTPRKIRR